MNRETNPDQILRDFLRLLRRNRALIIAVVVSAVAAAIAYSLLKSPVYEASARLQYNDQSAQLNQLGIPAAPPSDQTQRIAAASQVITSKQVIRRVARALNNNVSESEVAGSVSTTIDPSTNLVVVKTSARGPALAADLANEFARQAKIVATRAERAHLIQGARSLRRTIHREKQSQARALDNGRLSQLESLASVASPFTIVSPATRPSGPSSPQPIRDAALALALGLIFGLLIAFLRDSLDRRLTEAHDVEHQLRYPIVGYVESDALGGLGFSQNGTDISSTAATEAFRILRSNVEFLSPERPPRTIMVTSPVAEEGKSTVAAGLAIANALAGKRVLLLEADLRRPVLADRLKLSQKPGLTDWLVEAAPAADVVQVASIYQDNGSEPNASAETGPVRPNFAAIVAGTWSPQPAELLGSARFRKLLEEVTKAYDCVVLDCAPLLPVGDTLQLLPRVDAALVCVRLDQTTREQALAAKAVIDHFPPRPTGIVITGVRPGREGYYYGYYSSVDPALTVISPGKFG